MDFLLLPVLLQPVQAKPIPHEVHQRQRHENHQDLCNLDGAGSGGIRSLWHDSSRQEPGQPDYKHLGSLHGELHTLHAGSEKPACFCHTAQAALI